MVRWSEKRGSLDLPLGSGKVAGAGSPVPSAIGVPGQAALRAGFPVDVAAVQRKLGDSDRRADVDLLLQDWKEKKEARVNYSVGARGCAQGFEGATSSTVVCNTNNNIVGLVELCSPLTERETPNFSMEMELHEESFCLLLDAANKTVEDLLTEVLLHTFISHPPVHPFTLPPAWCTQ